MTRFQKKNLDIFNIRVDWILFCDGMRVNLHKGYTQSIALRLFFMKCINGE